MEGIRNQLARLLKATRLISTVIAGLTEAGLGTDPLFTAYGEVMDAIYNMIGEKTDTIDESVTYQAVHWEPFERGLDLLLAEYEKNNKQPSPVFLDKKLEQTTGAYRFRTTPEGEWL